MRLLLRPFLLILAAMSHATAADPTARPNPFGLVLHGGAGVIDRRNLTPEREAELRAKLTEAREAGYAVLQRGGPALELSVHLEDHLSEVRRGARRRGARHPVGP